MDRDELVEDLGKRIESTHEFTGCRDDVSTICDNELSVEYLLGREIIGNQQVIMRALQYLLTPALRDVT